MNALLVRASLLIGLVAGPCLAQLDSSLFAYIECYDDEGTVISRGSGVVVSRYGNVLTAKHVVPAEANCKASLGSGSRVPDRPLTKGRRSSEYDAMILRLTPDDGETWDPVNFMRLDPSVRNTAITAYGVPLDGNAMSARNGNLATVFPDGNGVVETTAMSTRGFSGGPVVLNDNGALVGIVVGVSLDPALNIPTNYGVLAVQEIAMELELIEVGDASIGTVETNGDSEEVARLRAIADTEVDVRALERELAELNQNIDNKQREWRQISQTVSRIRDQREHALSVGDERTAGLLNSQIRQLLQRQEQTNVTIDELTRKTNLEYEIERKNDLLLRLQLLDR